MKKLILILNALFFIISLQAQDIKKAWEVTALDSPESVVFDMDKKVYLVSNIAGGLTEKNGQGYISVINLDGTIKLQKWATGLHAPKGLGILDDELYIADIDEVVVVDLQNGKIKKRYEAKGATFLNDIEIAADGSVYVTDTFGGNAIYRIKNGVIDLWLKDDKLDYPNGLKIKGEELFVASWGVVTNAETFATAVPGKLVAINLKTKTIRDASAPTGNFDGIVLYKNTFLVSDWLAGSLFRVDEQGVSKKLKELNPGSADINFVEEQNVLLIPQTLDGTLVAYKLK